MKTNCILVSLFFLMVWQPVAANETSEVAQQFNRGISHFQQSRFEIAAETFETLIENPRFAERHADGYFWLAKSQMALGELDSASQNLEYYLHSFPNHPGYEEANYQRARILYLQSEYELAIQAFEKFTHFFSRSPFIANALYWSAESAFSLGRFSEARDLFSTVLNDFPTSFRAEAARYRISLLDLREREETLLELLRSSHQELLFAIRDFDRREREFQETITEYRRRIRSAASDEAKTHIDELELQIERLQSEKSELLQTITELQDELQGRR